jgi:hypothetical protein
VAHPCDTPRDRNPMHRYREAVRQRDEEVEACGTNVTHPCDTPVTYPCGTPLWHTPVT